MPDEANALEDLLRWAFEEENVRAIILNGSRGDPTRMPDEFSDYDAAVIVREMEPIKQGGWIERFGSPMVRWPLTPQPTFSDEWVTQLVLYEDGLRIDFQFTSPEITGLECPGPFHCVLLDRDALTESIRRIPVEGTTIVLPSEEEFADRINAFWWDIPYVAKALRRGEINYARFVMEADLRWNKLYPLLRWHVATVHGTDTDIGIFGRWLPRYVESDVWDEYLETFSAVEVEDQWQAMFAMVRIVSRLGRSVASHLDVAYPDHVDRNVRGYLAKLAGPFGDTRHS